MTAQAVAFIREFFYNSRMVSAKALILHTDALDGALHNNANYKLDS